MRQDNYVMINVNMKLQILHLYHFQLFSWKPVINELSQLRFSTGACDVDYGEIVTIFSV